MNFIWIAGISVAIYTFLLQFICELIGLRYYRIEGLTLQHTVLYNKIVTTAYGLNSRYVNSFYESFRYGMFISPLGFGQIDMQRIGSSATLIKIQLWSWSYVDTGTRRTIITQRNSADVHDRDLPAYVLSRTVIVPRTWQLELKNMICRTDDGSGRAYILSGPSNIGKTTFGTYMAQFMKYYRVTHVVGNLFAKYVNAAMESPCVIVIDEVCYVLRKICADNEIVTGDNSGTNIASWNNILDFIHQNDNVIMIMTTNMPIADIQKMLGDRATSMLRRGRIDGMFEISADGIVTAV